jgi:hypothetical protein
VVHIAVDGAREEYLPRRGSPKPHDSSPLAQPPRAIESILCGRAKLARERGARKQRELAGCHPRGLLPLNCYVAIECNYPVAMPPHGSNKLLAIAICTRRLT